MQILRTNLLLLLLLSALLAPNLALTSFDSSYCNSATGICGGAGGNYLLDDDEMSRRMLIGSLGTRYISYGALSRDRVPCSTAGHSYYNCQHSGAVNPYSRGCSRITHCYRDIS